MPFNWWGDKVSEEVREKARKANQTVGEAVLTEANKTVPHDEGTLERSGHVSTTDGDEIETYISYDTPYAVRWHEAAPGSVNFRGSGRAKWLELTVREMSDKIEEYLAKEMK